MTDPNPADVDEAASSSGRRQAVGIWVGAGLGVLVIAIVLIATLASGGDDSGAPPAAPPPNDVASGIVVTGTVVTPPGDYTEFCRILASQPGLAGATSTPEQLAKLAETLDYPALEQAAPADLKPTMRTLAKSRDRVVELFEQVDHFSEMTNADFPAGFLDALHVFTQATGEKCR